LAKSTPDETVTLTLSKDLTHTGVGAFSLIRTCNIRKRNHEPVNKKAAA